MAKSIRMVVRILVAIIGAGFMCVSGILDIQKIRGHYPAKALLMEDYPPHSQATTVTITPPGSTSFPYQFTQADLEFPAITPQAAASPKVYQQKNESLIPILYFSVKSVHRFLLLSRN
jgi:hypothetical protein